MKRAFLGAVAALAISTAALAATTTVQPLQLIITTTVTPPLSAITVTPATGCTSTTNGAISCQTPAANTGFVMATISCVTNPPGSNCTGAITLTGTDAAKFSLSNGGKVPTTLSVGATVVPVGTYSAALSETQ